MLLFYLVIPFVVLASALFIDPILTACFVSVYICMTVGRLLADLVLTLLTILIVVFFLDCFLKARPTWRKWIRRQWRHRMPGVITFICSGVDSMTRITERCSMLKQTLQWDAMRDVTFAFLYKYYMNPYFATPPSKSSKKHLHPSSAEDAVPSSRKPNNVVTTVK
jgi:hypothetical protein